MSLFKPINLGPLQLRHRIIISPPLCHVDMDEYFQHLKPEGGLVLVPSLGSSLDVSHHERIVKAIHDAGGVAFCRIDDNQQPIEKHVSDAVSAGYDGIEIDAGEGSSLEQALHEFQSPSLAISHISEILQSTTKIIPPEKIGIRFAPFTIVDGDYLSSLLTSYTALIEAIKLDFPVLGFVHFAGARSFDDFEVTVRMSFDTFRAAVAFPDNVNERTSGMRFVSSNNYNPDQAHDLARTGDLVCFGMVADGCPDLVEIMRKRAAYRLAPVLSSRLAKIDGRLRQGKECSIGWDSERAERIADAMNEIDSFLTEFNGHGTTFRKSCWFSCAELGQPLLRAGAEISKFDSEFSEQFTPSPEQQDFETRSSIAYLKRILDSALLTTASAIGIDEILDHCRIYYKLTKHASPDQPIKIPLNPHTNLLTATITNNPGIRVYDFAGAIRKPGLNGTIIMGGTPLYRWSEGKYLPTFHEVIVRTSGSVSIEAVLNFPDKTEVPRPSLGQKGRSFFHDVEQIKEDDRAPMGDLAAVRDIIAERHRLGYSRPVREVYY